jgi:hypothetical protein
LSVSFPRQAHVSEPRLHLAMHRATLHLAAMVPCARALKAARQCRSKADRAATSVRSRAITALSERVSTAHVRVLSPRCPSAPRCPAVLRSSASKAVAPPHFSLKLAVAPHHLLPICAGAHHEEPPYHPSFHHLRCCDPLHGERSPEHPLASFFYGYTCA